MKTQHNGFDEQSVIHELKHYLPAQSTLKDFVHHNTLHAFQDKPFFEGLNQASTMFGYKVLLNVNEYRERYKSGQIQKAVLEQVITDHKGAAHLDEWMGLMVNQSFETSLTGRIGSLRSVWKSKFKLDLDTVVHPVLFRILCSYLDQGVSRWDFPVGNKGFFASVREIEKNSFTSFFRTKKARNLILTTQCGISRLLKTLVGDDESLYERYLFDQQFAHQGWSGLVATIESEPPSLLNHKKITLKDLIRLELLLEIDAIENEFGGNWPQLGSRVEFPPINLFSPAPKSDYFEVLTLWQQAFEWSYYDQVLAGIKHQPDVKPAKNDHPSFQALFCIDDRECSLRRHLESLAPDCQTIGTPGFFSVEFYFKPEGGKFYSKLCPAPVFPKYLIRESGSKFKLAKDAHFSKRSHTLAQGWLITQTLGFWSAFKLFLNIFRPSMSPATAASFLHMGNTSKLTIENKGPEHTENGLQIGFTVEEMANRIEGMLRSTGMLTNFAPLVYAIGHGSSSTNNPHYAAYDCGACSGRPGSVNARVISFIGNHPKVRAILHERGIDIPDQTQFVGGLHDTSRDEIEFYDVDLLNPVNQELHKQNAATFKQALDRNAKERSRRLELINSNLPIKKIHDKIIQRSVSLFEPRPELNHATNSLCIVGPRELTKNLFLDRRAFLNSYDYSTDPTGKYLLNILKAAAPVCGGINLEYFFSRMDNQKLGAGSKLPHNVMGLIGVANGVDGDLRPGLPSQMIEVHDPIRLMIIVEHFPEVVLETIQVSPETYQWFEMDWVKLVVSHPLTKQLFRFDQGAFHLYNPIRDRVSEVNDFTEMLDTHMDNLPVFTLQ